MCVSECERMFGENLLRQDDVETGCTCVLILSPKLRLQLRLSPVSGVDMFSATAASSVAS